ncbi:MAG: hypothetical protein OZ921_12450 [Sorangiineae bacterium]|nr:hypothetical protein [Polyangiaceae bacterium]MEB2323317.1 hypothetical protein [Sorangiineae bacterium]
MHLRGGACSSCFGAGGGGSAGFGGRHGARGERERRASAGVCRYARLCDHEGDGHSVGVLGMLVRLDGDH